MRLCKYGKSALLLTCKSSKLVILPMVSVLNFLRFVTIHLFTYLFTYLTYIMTDVKIFRKFALHGINTTPKSSFSYSKNGMYNI